MYMSRLSALKEFSFMKVLRENGFNVPEPLAQNRHTVVMELVDAFPLRQISNVPSAAGLYAELIGIVMRLAGFGLIHGDFNEFNILVREDEVVKAPQGQTNEAREDETYREAQDPGTKNMHKPSNFVTPVIIDFPQMVSIDHINADTYFDRDIHCIKRFFERRYNFVSLDQGPFFADARNLTRRRKGKRLDVEVEASGFSKKMAKELEQYIQVVDAAGNENHDEDWRSRDADPDKSDESDSADDRSDTSPLPSEPLKDDKGLSNVAQIS